jgi:hypothetical protein
MHLEDIAFDLLNGEDICGTIPSVRLQSYRITRGLIRHIRGLIT